MKFTAIIVSVFVASAVASKHSRHSSSVAPVPYGGETPKPVATTTPCADETPVPKPVSTPAYPASENPKPAAASTPHPEETPVPTPVSPLSEVSPKASPAYAAGGDVPIYSSSNINSLSAAAAVVAIAALFV
ncbi:hypothetical protein BATDEDRAFT_37328 [Batrachochytrium dendrobatidis JAM81]|uniref:Uncharacterized protein n=1 Tax=Batrachochytrium dendrobatidis (strain JAM81 / FGSC 10211) TaxID=684364 RepID=F4P9R0_BATDJ|nr:uncharacterized protein BATDEDRAFT_37328 [Batrachochytrium dendrobatidis JAM81]EGF77820.1 hypothetical protein BATDEDRAFT_37328 [Batrachochytrium dendrobatidis JAM81]KAK5670319.1 hypothetical protein QVD99_003015 [Batrachochytrium dendrobatidis]|eukprot:XP_006681469.1 hypothetical protein BATDEDRAFT_37328 [Batrachochytrium dendrobatidis JAM81]